jgi:hypothetical protein
MKIVIYNNWGEPAVTHKIELEDAKEEGPTLKEQIDEEIDNFKHRLFSYLVCPGCMGTGIMYLGPEDEDYCYMCEGTGKKPNIDD